MLRKRKQIKRIIADVRDSICYSSIDEQSMNFKLPQMRNMTAFTRDMSKR